MVEKVDSQVYVLMKKINHFLWKWFQTGKVCFKTPEGANTCCEFNLENAICLQLCYFTLQNSPITRAEQCDGWSERGYIHMKGDMNKIENLYMFSRITESGLKVTLQFLQNFNKPSVAGAAAEMGHLWLLL